MFFKIGVVKNFAIFIGRHLYLCLFLIKRFVKRNSNTGGFLAKFLRTAFFNGTLPLDASA